MTMNKFTFTILLSLTMMLSCKRVNTELLYGEWQEIGTGKSIYTFKDDGTYVIDYKDDDTGEDKDHGTFEFQKNIIITKSDHSTGQESYRIKELEENKLVLDQSDMFEIKFVRIK